MRPELESIYHSAPVGLGVLDLDLRFVRVNERLAEMNGLPVAAHLGRTVQELLPDLAQQAEAMLQRVLDTGEAVRNLEIRGETPAQPGVERVWIEQILPLRDDDGRIEGLSVVAEEVTERRRAEQALERSEENLALAMDAAELALWEWRISSRELHLGNNWEIILGQPPKQSVLSRAAWLETVHPDDRAEATACIEAHLSGKTPTIDCEYRIRHADGRWLRVATRGRAVEHGADGRPTRSLGVARDVTAQRESSRTLLERAQLLQLAFDAIFTWSEQGGILSWNRGAELQYGYTEDEARGVHPNVLLDTVYPFGYAQVQQALRSEGVWRGELRHRAKDGQCLDIDAVMQHTSGPDGHVMVIAHDVTAARQSQDQLMERERELRHSQERLQIALDAGRMGVWDWTPSLQDITCSPEIHKLLGLPPGASSLPPRHFLEMVHPEDRAKLDAEVAHALAKGGDYEMEFRVVRTDGQTRWLVSRGRVLDGDDGERSRIVGVNFDITERKLIEQALHEADGRRNEFLAMLAHELRNPLAPIANAVRLLEVVGDSRDRREAATRILRRQTTHMARLVDDLMEAARITQGRIELRMENVQVATPVLQAVEAVRPQARERGQTVVVDVPASLDLVADAARLTQIVSNLVTNAVKYTQRGGRIEVSAQDDGDDMMSVIVQDDGPGVSAELAPRIFELFAQDARTLDRAEGGLGIGLALVKRLVELHGGHVRYENARPGPGARFVVCLPRHGRREDLRGTTLTAPSAHITPQPILVVDDNEDAADTLAMLLRMDGHLDAVANDGEQALRAALTLRPTVVLLDLGLPGIDGLEVARRLRRDADFSSAVLIAMSGYTQDRDRQATAQAGFDAHLAKPLDLSDIYRVVEERLLRPGPG